MSKQDIEKRLGFAAQGVKETTSTSAKVTMATPAESEQQKLVLKKGIASINKSISAGEANLRDDIKRANWSNAVSGCQALSSLYLRLKEMYAEWNKLARSTEYARPGVKAKFDTKVGSKGNKSAMIARNGPDADASWLAWVVQHHGEGQGESVLGTMRSYSTEARAKAAALRGLETSGLRGGFARPGAKAKMALTISTVGAKNLCYEALANLGELAKLAAETNSGWDFHVNVMINHVKDAIARMETKPTQAATDLDKAIDTLGMLKKIEPKRLNDIQKGSLKQLIGYVAKSLRDARANIKVVTTASRSGAKAKFAADAKISGEEIVWPSGLKLKIVAHSTLQQKSKAFQDALKEKNSGWVADYQLRGPRGAGYRMDVYSNGQYILTDANSSKAVLRGKLNMSRPGVKAEMAANEVPLDKPFTVRGKQVIVRKVQNGYEIFPTRGSYSLGKVNVLNREAVIQAMEAHNRQAGSHLRSILDALPAAKAKA